VPSLRDSIRFSTFPGTYVPGYSYAALRAEFPRVSVITFTRPTAGSNSTSSFHSVAQRRLSTVNLVRKPFAENDTFEDAHQVSRS